MPGANVVSVQHKAAFAMAHKGVALVTTPPGKFRIRRVVKNYTNLPAIGVWFSPGVMAEAALQHYQIDGALPNHEQGASWSITESQSVQGHARVPGPEAAY